MAAADLHAELRALVLGADPPGDRAPVPPDRWAALVPLALGARVGGALLEALDDGRVATDAAGRALLVERQRAVLARDLVLERRLLAVVERLAHAGVATVVLKGAASAHLDYGDPARRSFGDLDLLVAPEHIDVAVASLVADGARRAFPEPRPGYDRRFGKGVTLGGPDGVAVDLHRTLCAGPFGHVVLRALRGDGRSPATERFVLAGVELEALDAPSRWLHACLHAVLGGRRPALHAQRDVLVLQPTGRAAVDLALGEARRWQVDAVVQRALHDLMALGARVDPALARWAERSAPPAAQRRWLDVSVDRPSAVREAWATLPLVPWRDRPAFVAAGLAPRHRRGRVSATRRLVGAARGTSRRAAPIPDPGAGRARPGEARRR